MGGKKSFPVTRLELLLPGNLTRRKGTKPKRQQGMSKGTAQMIADISGVMPPISYSNYCSTLRDDSTPQLVLDLNFLPIEVITIFNFECEP